MDSTILPCVCFLWKLLLLLRIPTPSVPLSVTAAFFILMQTRKPRGRKRREEDKGRRREERGKGGRREYERDGKYVEQGGGGEGWEKEGEEEERGNGGGGGREDGVERE